MVFCRTFLFFFSGVSVILFLTECNPTHKEVVTFSEHVAPIIYKNCTPCHRAGQPGVIPLITYADVKNKAATIAIVTESRSMPPWPADEKYTHFIGERVLNKNEIEVLKEWAENKCPLGDTTKLPPVPEFYQGSFLGKPDLVLKIREPYFIKGDNKDRFLVMKIPYEIPHDTFVRAFEFVPGNRQLVHHMNGHMFQYEDAKKKNVFKYPDISSVDSLGTLENCYRYLNLLNDDGSKPEVVNSITNHLPGFQPLVYPSGIGGWEMKKKGAIIFSDIHYGPSPVDTTDQSYVNVFFTDKPPVRPTMELQMGTLGISDIVPPLVIPADSIKTFYTKALIKNDVSFITINPHMHLLGKTFWAFGIKPDGDTIPFIKINKWDFRWQYQYTFKKMLHIPKGTVLWVYGTFDNTSSNPNNPFYPPREISGRNGSMKTTDEMFQFIFTFLPYENGDENISLETN